MTLAESMTGPPGPTLADGRFAGRGEFTDMIRQAFAAAAVQGWREIVLSDADYSDWPLDERGVTEALNTWSRSGRKLTMMARSYDAVFRRHARFVVWRRSWAHLVECRGVVAASADTVPSALWSPGWAFERLDVARCSGVAGSDAARRVALKERLNEALRYTVPAFPASVLGL